VSIDVFADMSGGSGGGGSGLIPAGVHLFKLLSHPLEFLPEIRI